MSVCLSMLTIERTNERTLLLSKVPNLVTAGFQNFTAGLILAAVAAELFPLMLDTHDERSTWVRHAHKPNNFL